MLHSIIKQFLGSVVWGELDYLVVDLPPGTGDVALSLIQTVPLTGAVVVSTPSEVALQDARKAIEMFRQMKVYIVGMVENMSYFVCPHCSHEIDIFSRGGAEKTAKQFDVAYLGAIELDPRSAKPATAANPWSSRKISLREIPLRIRPQCSRVDEIKSTAGRRYPDSVAVSLNRSGW